MSLPAIQSYGEPNCMYSVVALVRAGEDAGACMKVITYALAFFASLVLTLTLVGMIPLSMCVQEYARQSTEQALNNHTSTPPLTNAETTALRQELAKKEAEIAALKAAPVPAAAPKNEELSKAQTEIATLRTQLQQKNREVEDRVTKAEEKFRKIAQHLRLVSKFKAPAFNEWKIHYKKDKEAGLTYARTSQIKL